VFERVRQAMELTLLVVAETSANQDMHNMLQTVMEMLEDLTKVTETRLARLESIVRPQDNIRLSEVPKEEYNGFMRKVRSQVVTLEAGEFITDAMEKSKKLTDLSERLFDWHTASETQHTKNYMKYITELATLVPNQTEPPTHVVMNSNSASLLLNGHLPGVGKSIGGKPGDVLFLSWNSNERSALTKVYLCFELKKFLGVLITSLCVNLYAFL
jgi:DNA uptake protein ComE-like DNA-binding protein